MQTWKLEHIETNRCGDTKAWKDRKCEDMGKVQTQENGEVETQTQETCRPTCRQGKTWTWKHKDMGDPDAETREHGNTKWKYADVETGRCRN